MALSTLILLFNFSLQSVRNVASRLTLKYSLLAVVSYETNVFLVYRHPLHFNVFRIKMRIASGPGRFLHSP